MQTQLEDLLALPRAQRARYARELIASLEDAQGPDSEAAWLAEIERRVQELDAGEAEPVAWSDLRARLRARLRGA